ncbi:MAG TPA: hypothetical protein VFH03_00655, partial [Actinoplanes sp.]|nr:hypothetical protein [Actinoplanes sp.]
MVSTGTYVNPDSVLARTAREMVEAHAGGGGPRDGMTICPVCGEPLPGPSGRAAAEVLFAAGLAERSGLVAAARHGLGSPLGLPAGGTERAPFTAAPFTEAPFTAAPSTAVPDAGLPPGGLPSAGVPAGPGPSPAAAGVTLDEPAPAPLSFTGGAPVSSAPAPSVPGSASVGGDQSGLPAAAPVAGPSAPVAL